MFFKKDKVASETKSTTRISDTFKKVRSPSGNVYFSNIIAWNDYDGDGDYLTCDIYLINNKLNIEVIGKRIGSFTSSESEKEYVHYCDNYIDFTKAAVKHVEEEIIKNYTEKAEYLEKARLRKDAFDNWDGKC